MDEVVEKDKIFAEIFIQLRPKKDCQFNELDDECEEILEKLEILMRSVTNKLDYEIKE